MDPGQTDYELESQIELEAESFDSLSAERGLRLTSKREVTT